MRIIRVLLTILLCLFAVARTAGADPAGFIYVAVNGTPPRVQVYSAATDALVTEFLLPARTGGMAISPDGSRLWVSCANNGPAATLVEIDARHHTLIGSYPVGVHGSLAVQRDNSHVFVLTDTYTVYSFDTSTHALVGSISGGAQIASALAANPVTDVVYVGRWSGTGWSVTAYDAATLAPLAEQTSTTLGQRINGLAVSHDGARVHLLLSEAAFAESQGGVREILDASSLAVTAGWLAQSWPYGEPVESRRTGELLALHGVGLLRFPLNADASPTRIDMASRPFVLTLPAGERRAVVGLSAPSSPLLKVVDLSVNAVVNTVPLTGPIAALTSTPPAVASCTYRLNRRYSSFTVNGGAGSVRLTSDCAWQARSSASWVHLDTTSGTAGATVGITVDPYPASGPYTPRSATVTIGGQLLTVTQAGGNSQPPFGFVDTPGEGAAGITGSLAVTGWALDDVGVTQVRVYREAVLGRPDLLALVGTATFVDGARPDLRALFPSLPFAPRAGWGLMVLSNMLPNGGNGLIRLHVYAEDVEGQRTLLGTRTITLANADATQPFGAIDTPSPGEEVSGVIVNWGWTLTPPGATIPIDGSTIDVVVDNVVVGHPTYNLFRSDIAALFPGYSNKDGAVGYFVIDTRTMANGIHSIAWVVRDDAGRARGIGSRYFTVFNE